MKLSDSVKCDSDSKRFKLPPHAIKKSPELFPQVILSNETEKSWWLLVRFGEIE